MAFEGIVACGGSIWWKRRVTSAADAECHATRPMAAAVAAANILLISFMVISSFFG